jgi:predicted small metal-binding protein
MSGSTERAGKLAIRCNCGWEVHGSEDEIVPPTQEHVRDVHWQEVSREDVLEMAEPYEGES